MSKKGYYGLSFLMLILSFVLFCMTSLWLFVTLIAAIVFLILGLIQTIKSLKSVTPKTSPAKTLAQRDQKIFEYRSQKSWTPEETFAIKNWKTDFVVLDVETTGLDPLNDEITEIAMIQYTAGIETKRFTTFVKPSKKIPLEIVELTGITDNDVKNAPLPIEIAQTIAEIIGERAVIAHNAEFDVGFITKMLESCDIDLSIGYLDTIVLARKTYPGLKNYKLQTLITHLHLSDEPQKHRAMDDAECTLKLFNLCKDNPNIYKSTTHSAKPFHNTKDMSITMKDLKVPDSVDPTSVFYKKTVVITGTLSISRKEAAQAIVNAGGFYRTAVSGKTDYLIVGDTEYDLVGDDLISSKEKRAYELMEERGMPIKIIYEKEFMEMIKPVIVP